MGTKTTKLHISLALIILFAIYLLAGPVSAGPTPTYDMTPSNPGELVTVTCWNGYLEVQPLGQDAMRVYCVKPLDRE